MPHYELTFSAQPGCEHYACVEAQKATAPEEITLSCVDLVAAFSAPCIRVRLISKAAAESCYDEIIKLEEIRSIQNEDI